ncbi:hypothetical protein OCHUTO_0240 [Orientia chuto str. Dubai]|uniref:Rod shape-determining protein n=1 Tax=Orientia chuto str. Dubai TaxID=1359168 RepID=A0A0F3MNT0_9RICK|nr:hypothetical protein OCHUTO_0240 [Orientia chuto str. Dubai]
MLFKKYIKKVKEKVLSLYSSSMAIDLGTANTLVYVQGKE